MLAHDIVPAIAALPPGRFATLDGAFYENLPRDLAAAGLFAQPLYRDGADARTVAAGPHVVAIATPDHANALLALMGDRPALVFWSWPDDGASLIRHLRTLNVARVALGHAPQWPEDWATMLFRHADPDVLGLMLEVMTAEQRETLFGRSPLLAIVSPKLGGIRTWSPAGAC